MNESIKRLEEKVAYLERHVAEQDKVMLELGDALALLRRELKALRERASAAGARDEVNDSDRDLPGERPPHY